MINLGKERGCSVEGKRILFRSRDRPEIDAIVHASGADRGARGKITNEVLCIRDKRFIIGKRVIPTK